MVTDYVYRADCWGRTSAGPTRPAPKLATVAPNSPRMRVTILRSPQGVQIGQQQDTHDEGVIDFETRWDVGCWDIQPDGGDLNETGRTGCLGSRGRIGIFVGGI